MKEITEAEIRAAKVVTPLMAANYLHRGVDTIRYGMQAKMFPFGVAFKPDAHARWIYHIQGEALIKYKNGELT